MNETSYRELENENLLENGLGTGYGLGLRLSSFQGHRRLEHAGEIAGFYAENIQLPDDKAAIAVLTNLEMPTAAREIADGVVDLLLMNSRERGSDVARAREALLGLQHGRIDRTQFTPDASAYFDQRVLADYAASLGPLGDVVSVSAGEPSRRADQRFVTYTVHFKSVTVLLNTSETSSGEFARFLVQPSE